MAKTVDGMPPVNTVIRQNLPGGNVDPFSLTKYFVQKSLWKIIGGEVRIYDQADGQLLLFVKQKGLVLKEDITICADEQMTRPLIKIQNTNLKEMGWKFDIIDLTNNTKLGGLQRRKFHTYTPNDPYIMLDPNDQEIGNIYGSSAGKDYLRMMLGSYIPNLIPRAYTMALGTTEVGKITQQFHLFAKKFDIDFSADSEGKLNRKLGLAAAIFMTLLKVERPRY